MEIKNITNPINYIITYCLDEDKESCVEYEIVVDGEISNKPAMVFEHLESIPYIVEMPDGTMINLKQFKYAYIDTVSNEIPKPDINNSTSGGNVVNIFSRLKPE